MRTYSLDNHAYAFGDIVGTAQYSFEVCIAHLLLVHRHARAVIGHMSPEDQELAVRKIDQLERVNDYLIHTYTALYYPRIAADYQVVDVLEPPFPDRMDDLVRLAAQSKPGYTDVGLTPVGEVDLLNADVGEWGAVLYVILAGNAMFKILPGPLSRSWSLFPYWNLSGSGYAAKVIQDVSRNLGWGFAFVAGHQTIQFFDAEVGTNQNPRWTHYRINPN